MSSKMRFWPFIAAMAIIVAASNYLVQFPFQHFGLGDILTWGAFTYPIAFLINDLTNRSFGVRAARIVVMVGFVLAFAVSLWLATPRIALASGLAFLFAQHLDVKIFDCLRRNKWWQAPFISTMLGSVLDTLIFFSVAFASLTTFLDTSIGLEDGSLAFEVPFWGFGPEIPLWVSLAVGDFLVKILIGLAMLLPYGTLLSVLRPVPASR